MLASEGETAILQSDWLKRMTAEPVDYAIVVALAEELVTLWKYFDVSYESVFDAKTNNIYYQFSLPRGDGERKCVLTLIGEMGPTNAALVVGSLLERYQPDVVAVVGIGATLSNDVKLGDVVAATSVDSYIESGKFAEAESRCGISADTGLRLAGEVFRCDPRLIAGARNAQFTNPEAYGRWQQAAGALLSPLLATTTPATIDAPAVIPASDVQLHDGPIASGPVVVASGQFRQFLLSRNRKYAAVEMESAGVAALLNRLADRPGLLVLKGISDRADAQKSELDSLGSFRTAAMASASLLLRMLIEEDVLIWPTSSRSGTSRVVTFVDQWGDLFVGRQAEMEILRNMLSEDERRIITIVGEGGIGKTRLANELVRTDLPRFRDGAVILDMGSTFEVEAMTNSLRRGLMLEPGDPASAAKDIATALNHKDMLVVLDNFESVVESAPVVQQIVDAAADVRFLVTSREPLKVRSERILRLGPLPYPQSDELANELVGFDAAELFLARAKEAIGNELSPTLLPLIGQLCRRVGGVPLGVELLARQTTYLGVAEIAEALDTQEGATRLLADRRRGIVGRHQSLAAVFDSSVASLAEQQMNLLIDVSVFMGGASLVALMNLYDRSDASILDDLRVLVDKSLLRVDRAYFQEARYTMLPPVRDYLRARWRSHPQRRLASEAHACLFLGLAERAGAELFGSRQVGWLSRVEADVWNFRAACQWFKEHGQIAEAMAIVGHLSRFWSTRDFLALGRELSDISDESENAIPPQTIANWRTFRGLLAWYSGDYPAADIIFAKVAEYGSDDDAPWFEANGLANRGLVAQSDGRPTDALDLYCSGEAVARRAGDDWNLAVCRVGVARALHELGDLPVALETYEESLDLFRRVGDLWSVGRVLRRLLVLAQETDNDALFEATLPAARRSCVELSHVYGTAQLDSILAARAARRGETQDALSLYLTSADVFARLGVSDELVSILDQCVVLFVKKAELQIAGLLAGLAGQLRPAGATPSLEETVSRFGLTSAGDDQVTQFGVAFRTGLHAEARAALHSAMSVLAVS